MNLKLDLVRLTNEDVIATSACSAHPNTIHLYTTRITPTGGGNYGVDSIKFDAGITNTSSNINLDKSDFAHATDGATTKNTWYYYDNNDSKYHLCNGNHNDYNITN